MRSDRLYLVRRRVYWTRRFKAEFGWGWRYCWDTAGRNQRFALVAAAELRAEQLARDEFALSVMGDLDRLDILTIEGAL